MTGQLPIVGIAPPLKAAFAPSDPGTLAIKARSGASLPGGKLVLIASRTVKCRTAYSPCPWRALRQWLPAHRRRTGR